MEVSNKQLRKRLYETLSSLNQERVRLKKRRLKNHFKEDKNITGAAFTIASEEFGGSIFGGYFLKLGAKSPAKPMQAAEGYCLDHTRSHILSPVFYALYMFYCWELDSVPVTFHFTSTPAMERCESLLSGKTLPEDLIEEAVLTLCRALPKVEVLSCLKGAFFEKMQSKMFLAKNHQINEMVLLDFEVIAKCLLKPES